MGFDRCSAPPRWDSDRIPPRPTIAASLSCQYPLTLNIYADAAQEHCARWVSRLFGSASMVRRVTEAKMASMVAGFYPTTGVDELCITADYLCWAFALDDAADETPLGQYPSRLSDKLSRYDEILRGAAPGGGAEASDVALFDILERLARFTTAEQMAAFETGNRAYFGAMLWEANNRARGWVPNESSFLRMRPAAGAVHPFFALIEPLEKISLAPETRANADVAELVRLAGGIVCWINDVLSYEKERRHGELHNLAIVYEVHRGLAPGAAIAHAVSLCNAEMSGFVARREALRPFGAQQDRELAKFVAVMQSMMRVTLDWTLGSARYAEPDACVAASA